MCQVKNVTEHEANGLECSVFLREAAILHHEYLLKYTKTRTRTVSIEGLISQPTNN